VNNILKRIKGIRVLDNEPLEKHTSFRIGGGARYFIKVYSIKALKKVLEFIKKRRMRYFVIGAGTNILCSDAGFDGAVIKLEGIFKRIKREDNFFICGAGVTIDRFLTAAGKAGYGGAEFLAGIPGTIGGAVKGNAGAFGRSISEIIEGITVIDTGSDLGRKDLFREELRFDYRRSHIKDDKIILFATLKLKRRAYKYIQRALSAKREWRRRRQPAGYSAGSFFKNPRPQSAGKLIEECGLLGLRVGGAEVSRKHGNWIINTGNAKASDVLKLMRIIKQTVRLKKGVLLKEEVKILR